MQIRARKYAVPNWALEVLKLLVMSCFIVYLVDGGNRLIGAGAE
jgi:hypothetical protein